MLQFLLEWPHSVSREFLSVGQSPMSARRIEVAKTADVVERMRRTYDASLNPHAVTLSPSALNAYLECPLRFYFRYVAHVSRPDDVSSDIDSALFGTLFHRSAELAYTDLKAIGAEVHAEDIERLLADERRLQGYVDRAFKEEFFKVPLDERPEYNGTQLIHSKVICSYLKQLLRVDLRQTPFSVVSTECRVSEQMAVEMPDGEWRLSFGGIIDRMDSRDDTLRIVDYKTGGTPAVLTDVASLFTPSEKRHSHIFQTFVYASIMTHRQPLKVSPALLYIHKAAAADYSPVIEMGEPRKTKVPVGNFSLIDDEFRQHLTLLLQEIFSPAKPFSQTEFASKCESCDFRSLCRK
jgi:hypothetical protein